MKVARAALALMLAVPAPARAIDAAADDEALEPGRFVWTLDGPGPPRRFVISLEAPEDAWHEWGEVSLDGGRSWRRFFEMRLDRVR